MEGLNYIPESVIKHSELPQARTENRELEIAVLPLSRADQRISKLNYSQLDFIASVLS